MFLIFGCGKPAPQKQSTAEDLRMVYQAAVSEIQFFKQQQWKVANYVLLLYAAITGIYLKTSQASAWIFCIAVVLDVVVCLFGSFLLWDLETAARRARGRLNMARARLTPDIPPATDRSFVVIVLIVVLAVGLALSVWASLYVNKC